MNVSVKRFVLPLAVVTLLSFMGCKSTPNAETTAGTSSASEESSDLSITEAQARKARVSDVQYQVAVNLTGDTKNFTGTSRIVFGLKDTGKPLRVDFFEGQVKSLTVNGQLIPPETAKKKYWIELPTTALVAGANTVTIEFAQEYSHQGQGLHRFVDPENKDVFVYTQFETFDANRFMPCFDQPDLRATLALTVDAPAKWTMISTTRETAVKTLPNGTKQWQFPVTQPIATYLFSLHGGPFKVWTDKFEDIPLRLFARPTMAKYVDAKEFFLITKQGLKFYNTFFDFKYPFGKFDQIIVPEFNAGAMENVGAITYTEGYFSRGKATRPQRRSLATTILHEMGHMWFGDTVTMAWWNDLWLNESFATFVSTQAMVEATEYKEAWQDFYASEKNWAYWEDGLVTTHPIEAPVAGVKDAFATFDGITYGKGASVLKQLWAYMGPEKFQKGLRTYIKTYAFKNATLAQFIAALQTETTQDLNAWAERWLRQSGADKLAVKWNCEGDQLKTIELTSTPIKDAKFRPQAVQVALFGDKGGALVDPTVVRVELTQRSQMITGNWACPAFVYPNYSDFGYARVSLDPKSLSYAKKGVSKINDNLLRTMVWNDLWQMVRDTEMSLNDYIQIVNTHFAQENDELILQQIVATITGRRGERSAAVQYWPQTTEKDRASRLVFIGKIEDQYLTRFNAAKPGSDDQKFWFDSYVSGARTTKGLDQLATWATMKEAGPGFKLDVDRKWALARELARFEHKSAAKLLLALKKEDPSDRGQKQALSAEAIAPTLSVKQKWVDILKQPKPTVTFAEARSVLGALFPVEQDALAKRFENDFYTYLKANGASENEIFVETVASGMSPLSCDEKQSAKMKTFLSTVKGFTPSVIKTLRVGLQEDERCQTIRAASAL